MPKISLADIKNIFRTGNKPTAQNYSDTFDSFVHMDNLTAVNGQIVDTKISNYDNALKSRNSDGSINSLGDVFAFLLGLADTVSLKSMLDNIGWSTIKNRPEYLNLSWNDQFIDAGANVVLPPTGGVSQGWLCQPSTGGASPQLPNNNFLIIDLQVNRQAFTLPSGGVIYCDLITRVKVAINIKSSTTAS